MKFSALRNLDAYARAEEHLTTQTISGAVVSVVSGIFMLLLFCNELYTFYQPLTLHELAVDDTRGEKLDIHINITFPALPCILLSLDALDQSGKHETDLNTNLFKTNIAANGNNLSKEPLLIDEEDPLSKDIIADSFKQANFRSAASSESVRKIKIALARREGCNIAGYLEVDRVAGNFHVSVHSQSFHVLDAVFTDVRTLNVSHAIHSLSFGPEFPGIVNPLDGTKRILTEEEGTGTFKYFLKVVPTTYNSLNGPDIPTNQFSVTEYFMKAKARDNQLPAAYFMYDLYPITVNIKEQQKSLGHFLTRLCAVIGGVFAVSGMLDRLIHSVVFYANKVK
mmetsp:Transcript_32124/g.44540  ORF Transcript_32124/g.44540 Transcript_32124/m.44540 type:complete len:338 (+) Transcript_32124:258-1271(+)|eukprot:CAMPEP_0196586166 /NCGR_PEP_ID=MMETSP1081-20130531/53374_1 /TAXON_ID=36882 /ORGANISM="Pyramimonas amylifera, Strain CCMP720" /LENGTH=337 /DNA_ID=CAMNT_0041907951 /DNA_START=248 /DNA_END=1261 /DNA_ORIENTATION=+